MHKMSVAILLSCLLLSIPLRGQEVFIRDNNQAAVQARTSLEKFTRYKLSGDATHFTLLVEEQSWSPDLLSPATVAISMKLISPRGELLWGKTEPIGARSKEATIQDLLKELAEAKPNLGKKSAVGAEQNHK